MGDRTKAVFTKEFHYSSRKRNAGWSAYPDKKPQTFPREFIEAAIAAGCADPVKPKKSTTKSSEIGG